MQLVCPCWGWLSTQGLRILPTCGWKFLEGAPLNLYQKGEAGVYYEELTTWEGVFPKVAKPGGWVGSPKHKQRGHTKVSVPQGLRRSGCRLRGPPGNTAKPFRFRSCFSPLCVAYIHTHTHIYYLTCEISIIREREQEDRREEREGEGTWDSDWYVTLSNSFSWS